MSDSKKYSESFDSTEIQNSIFSKILNFSVNEDKIAVIGDKEVSYKEIRTLVTQFTDKLKSISVNKSEIIGICLPFSVEYIISLLSVYKSGAISVLINPSASSYEREYIRKQSGIRYIITNKKNVIKFNGLINSNRKHQYKRLEIVGPLHQKKNRARIGDCIIIYSSGSTGRPKGVLHTEQSISSNVRAVCDYLKLTARDRTIVFTPPAYAYAVSQTLTHLWAGGSILPYALGLRFPSDIYNIINNHRLTGISANPTAFRMLTSVTVSSNISLDSVRYIMSGGQHLDSSLAHQLSQRFSKARIVSMYGCTENSPRISYYWLPKDIPDSNDPIPVGKAVHGTKIKVSNLNGFKVPKEIMGEILIKGSSLMRCYWKNSKLSKSRFLRGWFKTGDLGFIDKNGNLNIRGRIDNVINVGNEKVSPEEIEEVIRKIDGILDAGVTAIADPLLGNVPIALVVEEEGKNLKTLIHHTCLMKLSHYKVPKKYIRVSSLPRTLYGKIDRKELKIIAKDFGITNSLKESK